MTFQHVRELLVARLEQGDRGDRGWFIITRVHVALSWLKGISEYIEARGSGTSVVLTPQDYHRLATIIETTTADPGVQLRRHHLLVMDKPLQLLRRPNEPSWQEVELTVHGRALANSEDPAATLEAVLSEVRFASTPWCSSDRAKIYDEFEVPVYEAMRRVLSISEGYIERDEFDLFVSRIRNLNEVDWATDAIEQYRQLSPGQQQALRSEVKSRIPGEKAYANWRDVGLHTFSLFSLGTSMLRDGTFLRLTQNWAAKHTEGTAQEYNIAAPELKMPTPDESDALLTPPAAPARNDGADAESFVAKVFRSQGWSVAFYTNRRGFGFDLWARRQNVAIVIEVKSSVGSLGAITLTENEFRAAEEYGENFVLALVERLDSDSPILRLIENPAATLDIVERASTTFTISRNEWLRAVQG